jgi:hypothetical protein
MIEAVNNQYQGFVFFLGMPEMNLGSHLNAVL